MCASCSWQQYLNRLNRLLVDERYVGEQTWMEGVREKIIQSNHVTAGEAVTIHRIEDGLGRRQA